MVLPADCASRRISWVIPAYNEAPIFAETTRQLREWAARTGRELELIVVDDGTDDLQGELARAGLADAVEYVRGPRLGKGAAVRDGILASTGDIVVYCDADLPIALDDMEACIAAVERGPARVAVPERPWTFRPSRVFVRRPSSPGPSTPLRVAAGSSRSQR